MNGTEKTNNYSYNENVTHMIFMIAAAFLCYKYGQ